MLISAEAFKKRAESLAGSFRKKHIGALFLEPGSNFRYLTGLEIGRSERLTAILLDAQGGLHLVGPSFEEERLQAASARTRIHLWKEDEDPYKLIREDVLPGSKKLLLAVGPTTRYFVVENLRIALPGWNIVSAGPMLENARLCKDRSELGAMRKATAKTLLTMASVTGIAREGMTELELAREIGGGIVQFGENAAVPHGGPTDRKLKRGDAILVDTGHTVEGYWSDLTRTFFFGTKTAEFKKVYRIVEEAQIAAVKAVKPGATYESIDKAARSVIEDAGYGEFFIHRTGHGLGIDVHEPPYLVKGNKTKLQPGMVVTIEPGIYLPGRFGVRIEDDVAVTEKGHRILSAGR